MFASPSSAPAATSYHLEQQLSQAPQQQQHYEQPQDFGLSQSQRRSHKFHPKFQPVPPPLIEIQRGGSSEVQPSDPEEPPPLPHSQPPMAPPSPGADPVEALDLRIGKAAEAVFYFEEHDILADPSNVGPQSSVQQRREDRRMSPYLLRTGPSSPPSSVYPTPSTSSSSMGGYQHKSLDQVGGNSSSVAYNYRINPPHTYEASPSPPPTLPHQHHHPQSRHLHEPEQQHGYHHHPADQAHQPQQSSRSQDAASPDPPAGGYYQDHSQFDPTRSLGPRPELPPSRGLYSQQQHQQLQQQQRKAAVSASSPQYLAEHLPSPDPRMPSGLPSPPSDPLFYNNSSTSSSGQVTQQQQQKQQGATAYQQGQQQQQQHQQIPEFQIKSERTSPPLQQQFHDGRVGAGGYSPPDQGTGGSHNFVMRYPPPSATPPSTAPYPTYLQRRRSPSPSQQQQQSAPPPPSTSGSASFLQHVLRHSSNKKLLAAAAAMGDIMPKEEPATLVPKEEEGTTTSYATGRDTTTPSRPRLEHRSVSDLDERLRQIDEQSRESLMSDFSYQSLRGGPSLLNSSSAPSDSPLTQQQSRESAHHHHNRQQQQQQQQQQQLRQQQQQFSAQNPGLLHQHRQPGGMHPPLPVNQQQLHHERLARRPSYPGGYHHHSSQAGMVAAAAAAAAAPSLRFEQALQDDDQKLTPMQRMLLFKRRQQQIAAAAAIQQAAVAAQQAAADRHRQQQQQQQQHLQQRQKEHRPQKQLHRQREQEEDGYDDYDDDPDAANGAKGKRGRPRKHAPKIPLPPLYVFIRNMLHNHAYNPKIISWVNEPAGIFKVSNTAEFAKTWGRMKSNRSEEMNYEKMSRAMRYHYGNKHQGRKGHLAMVKEKRLVYKFGELAINWRKSEVVQEQCTLGDLHELCKGQFCLWSKE